jgi:hypothetical protein
MVFTPREQSSPQGGNFTPGVTFHPLVAILKTVLCFADNMRQRTPIYNVALRTYMTKP